MTDLPNIANNAVRSLFSHCTLIANGKKICSPNGNWAQKVFLTEVSTNKQAKDTWLKYQGYNVETNPGNFTTQTFTDREAESRQSSLVSLIGKVAADIFTCEKHLISGVTLRISILRKRPKFCLIFDDVPKDYKIKNNKATLHVKKMTVSKNVCTAIEKTFTKMLCIATLKGYQKPFEKR